MSLGGGGAQLQPDLVGKIDASVATARPGTGYGMTETCVLSPLSAVTSLLIDPRAGPAMPSFEAQIVNADGEAVTEGTGELWVRGAPVVKVISTDRRRRLRPSPMDGCIQGMSPES